MDHWRPSSEAAGLSSVEEGEGDDVGMLGEVRSGEASLDKNQTQCLSATIPANI